MKVAPRRVKPGIQVAIGPLRGLDGGCGAMVHVASAAHCGAGLELDLL